MNGIEAGGEIAGGEVQGGRCAGNLPWQVMLLSAASAEAEDRLVKKLTEHLNSVWHHL